jgi:hypothetical protein
LHDGDVTSTDDPLHHDHPENHPTRSANVTAPYPGFREPGVASAPLLEHLFTVGYLGHSFRDYS